LLDINLKTITLNQNNCANSNVNNNAAKSFNILAINLSVLHNHSMVQTILLDLYLTKF